MTCNQCRLSDTKVLESRDANEGRTIRRRRICLGCQSRFTTYERMEQAQLVVVKNNGTRELFSRDKLKAGLFKACEKTAVTSLDIEKIVSAIERDLQVGLEQEVSSNMIGQMVMERLAVINEVAYVRFASVYRRFKDITGFEKELLQIRRRKLAPADSGG